MTYNIVSLFTGAGGLDLGLEAAGFETRVAVEMDADAVATIRANDRWPVIPEDIHEVTSTQLIEEASLKEAQADLLVGGPPCQPFSKSGYWASGDAKRLNDPRATTLEAYLRVLMDIKPRAFLLENVAGLAYKNKSEGLELLQKTIESINAQNGTAYRLSVGKLNAADFGVPQERERVFIIGHRGGKVFDFERLEATHQCPDRGGAHDPDSGGPPKQSSLLTVALPDAVTAWDAIGDLEDDDDPTLKTTGKWAELLPSIPEGCNYSYHTARGGGRELFGWRTRYWSFLLKLAKRYPSWTITAQPGPAIGPFHWKSRKLSCRELCRLQTFPDDYKITGNWRAYQRQLGNAVPSALTEMLGLQIRHQLFGEGSEILGSLTLLPTPKRAIPVPEPVAPVPDKYLKREGGHAAHPGTGLGPGASSRRAS